MSTFWSLIFILAWFLCCLVMILDGKRLQNSKKVFKVKNLKKFKGMGRKLRLLVIIFALLLIGVATVYTVLLWAEDNLDVHEVISVIVPLYSIAACFLSASYYMKKVMACAIEEIT